MLSKFNYGQSLDEELLAKIRIFMDDKWAYDKNNFLITKNDQSLLDQLPSNCQTQIYKDYLFRDFLQKFRRFFNFNNNQNKNPLIVKIKKKRDDADLRHKKVKIFIRSYPYHRYDDEMFCSFMKNLMNSLEIRKFREGEIIANEMEESLEVMFVNKGRYDIGYEINNKKFFRR